MSAPSTAKELLARLLPTWRNRLINLNAKRRQVLWGDTQVVLRVRDYPKSKTEEVTLTLPNFLRVRLWSETLQRKVPLTMTNEMLRQVEDRGGLDDFLLRTPDSRLKSDVASAVKWEVTSARRKRALEKWRKEVGKLQAQAAAAGGGVAKAAGGERVKADGQRSGPAGHDR